MADDQAGRLRRKQRRIAARAEARLSLDPVEHAARREATKKMRDGLRRLQKGN